MEAQQDFKELFALFNLNKVEYLIVGGYALAFHGAPRFTGDIDILINSTRTNAQRILNALGAFGFGSLNLSLEDFSEPRNVIQLGVPPARIDILTSISGVTWNEADVNKIAGTYGDIDVCYIGLKEFEINKRATGRMKDLADIEALNKNKSEQF